MSAIGAFEPRTLARMHTGEVMDASEWRALADVDALLERINALQAAATEEIAQAREAGYQAGFAEGLTRAQQQMTQQLAALNERRARTLAEAEGRIADLACAIVARIAPGLDAERLVPPLVVQAVEAAQAEQFLLIRVHPDARAAVAGSLGEVRQAHPAVGVIELVADESLDPHSCVVVSEAGEVRAGVQQQIEAIRQALAAVGQAAA
ncbi:FliH/SctL family protein [Coralloluteibacterium thermophilus]|uniref:Flagellar assembly protein FliH n=1 Tax=Coralloluteibacterium thermophilum TaxID=2707049 RepID=A0ABV9NQG6_9GAMM